MDATAVLRRFNRTYTQRIGVLEESFLGTGRPVAVSRLLFEIGLGAAPTVRDLRQRLDLDSGQLSRMLRQLEQEGLITTGPDPIDRRRRVVRLTAHGRVARDELDDRSEALAARLLAPLTDRQCERLSEALSTAEVLVRAATVTLTEVRADDPLARAATSSYIAELDRRFPGGFRVDAPGAAEPGATYVVAISDGEVVAHGGLRRVPELGPQVTEIKRMWVHPDWRGLGLGGRMLRHLEQLAGHGGSRRIVLDTNSTLTEAIAMYDRAGYDRVDCYNDNPYAEAWFAKDLVAEGQ